MSIFASVWAILLAVCTVDKGYVDDVPGVARAQVPVDDALVNVREGRHVWNAQLRPGI